MHQVHQDWMYPHLSRLRIPIWILLFKREVLFGIIIIYAKRHIHILMEILLRLRS